MQDHNEVIQILSELYPKCFFSIPQQRRPLKKNIIVDIQRFNDQALSGFDIGSAVDWYMSHIGYDYACAAAGTQRIDLDGKAVGKITSSEAREAQDRITVKKAEIAERRAWKAPVTPSAVSPPATHVTPSASRTDDVLVKTVDEAVTALAKGREMLLPLDNITLRNALLKSAINVAEERMQEVLQEIEKKE